MNTVMSDNTPPKSFFQKYRLPILLGLLAVSLYGFSILYIIYGKGQIS